MKKFLSIFLSLAMVLSLSTTTFATSPTSTANAAGVTILKDNETVRIAETTDGTYRYVSTLNKQNNTITSERFSLSGELEATAIVNLDTETIYNSQTNSTTSTRSVIASKKTESVYAYEYTNGNPKEWKLTRAKYANEDNDAGYYFRTKQTSVNKDDLDAFRVAVDSLASKESDLSAQVGVTIFFGAFSTGFAIGAGPVGWGIAAAGYIAAAGFGLTAQSTANQIGELQSTALAKYTDVKNESSIYF